MSRKSAQISPMGLAMKAHGEFMQKKITAKHGVNLLIRLRRGNIRTYADLREFIKECEKDLSST